MSVMHWSGQSHCTGGLRPPAPRPNWLTIYMNTASSAVIVDLTVRRLYLNDLIGIWNSCRRTPGRFVQRPCGSTDRRGCIINRNMACRMIDVTKWQLERCMRSSCAVVPVTSSSYTCVFEIRGGGMRSIGNCTMKSIDTKLQGPLDIGSGCNWPWQQWHAVVQVLHVRIYSLTNFFIPGHV